MNTLINQHINSTVASQRRTDFASVANHRRLSRRNDVSSIANPLPSGTGGQLITLRSGSVSTIGHASACVA